LINAVKLFLDVKVAHVIMGNILLLCISNGQNARGDRNNGIDKFRNSAGLKYEVFKGFKVNLFYIWQPDYSKKHVHNYHIAGLDLEFTLKPGRSKK
jgi:hypothetical protein